MTRALRITVFALIAAAMALLASTPAEALLEKHDCTFCHSLHGGTSSFVPDNSPTNLEVLCLGCHLTAIDGTDPDSITTDPVQPHRTGEASGGAGFMGAYYVTCSNCHAVHDNQPNWRAGHSDTADGNDGSPPPTGWVEGINAKMIGREDPDGETPYAIIQTREADFDKNGIPDRGAAVTVNCDDTFLNDCFVQGKRHVIFENFDPDSSGASIHGFADNNEDGVDDTTAIGIASNVSDSGINYSQWDSVCQICHSQTANHNVADGRGLTHNSGRACTVCHEHGFCFDRGNSCAKWVVPNRDLQVDTVSAAPASVNTSDTVTITVDVTNLGDNLETIKVRYYSDIEGSLGWSTVADVASAGSAQTSLDWVTTTAGAHTITADIVPVIGEIVTGNNSGTDTVTVVGADNHDVAVTSVTAPSPIPQGDTETVSVDIANPGTFTETFDVTLVSSLDGPIQTLSSGVLAPSGTTTLNFSWNTTGAALGSHTLTATAVHDGGDGGTDSNTGNNSANTNSTVAVHDVAVTLVTAPASADQGTTPTVSVDIANLSSTGGFSETFNVTLYDDTDTVTIGTQNSGAMAAGGTNTLNFSWNTTGASIATHTLRAVADTVPSETITANNTATTTSDVIAPVTHDAGVVQIQTVGNVEQGTTEVVLVDVWNYGGAAENFDVTLSSDQDGSIDSPQSVVSLAAGTGTTVSFSWVTGAGTTVGAHTLTATTTLGTDSNAGNNSGTTGATIQEHNLSMVSVTDTPDPVTVGGTVTIDATVSNIGDFAETFDVTLTSDLDGLIHTWTNVNLGVGATTTPALTYNWDTTGATTGSHTLTATAVAVTNEFITANNSTATTNQVNSAGVNDVAVLSVVPAPNNVKLKANGSPTNVSIAVIVENQGDFTETFDVTLVSNLDGTIQTLSATNLGAGQQTQLDFTWSVNINDNTIGTHTLTATANTVSGETDTADNAANYTNMILR